MKRRRLVVLALGLLLLLGGWQFNRRRTMGVRDAINPLFWVRRARGTDLFDARQRILFHGNRALPEVALTFDDGPHEKTSSQILFLLQAFGARATFFIVGDRIKERPKSVVRMLAEGHEVGNHTQTHQHRLDILAPANIRNELFYCDANLARSTERRFTLMRPPGLRYNDTVLGIAREMGYTTVGYTVGARDYEPVTADFIANRIVSRLENGAIILLHDGNPATVEALPRILTEIRGRGYKLVTISEMLDRLPQTAGYSERMP